MKQETKIKIINLLVGDVLTFKVIIPLWLVGFIILLPIITYADLMLLGRRSFLGYLAVSALEIFLVGLGFVAASSQFKIKKLLKRKRKGFRTFQKRKKQ